MGPFPLIPYQVKFREFSIRKCVMYGLQIIDSIGNDKFKAFNTRILTLTIANF